MQWDSAWVADLCAWSGPNWILMVKTKWYQVKAAILKGTLFWGPHEVTIQDGGFPIALHMGLCSALAS